LAGVEAELGEAPLATGVGHHAGKHVKVAFCVLGGAAATLKEVADFKDVNRAFIT